MKTKMGKRKIKEFPEEVNDLAKMLTEKLNHLDSDEEQEFECFQPSKGPVWECNLIFNFDQEQPVCGGWIHDEKESVYYDNVPKAGTVIHASVVNGESSSILVRSKRIENLSTENNQSGGELNQVEENSALEKETNILENNLEIRNDAPSTDKMEGDTSNSNNELNATTTTTVVGKDGQESLETPDTVDKEESLPSSSKSLDPNSSIDTVYMSASEETSWNLIELPPPPSALEDKEKDDNNFVVPILPPPSPFRDCIDEPTEIEETTKDVVDKEDSITKDSESPEPQALSEVSKDENPNTDSSNDKLSELNVWSNTREQLMESKLASISYPFECPECGKIFEMKFKLVDHMEIHDPLKRPYKCLKCGKTFTREIDTKRHNKKYHRSRAKFEYLGEKPQVPQVTPETKSGEKEGASSSQNQLTDKKDQEQSPPATENETELIKQVVGALVQRAEVMNKCETSPDADQTASKCSRCAYPF